MEVRTAALAAVLLVGAHGCAATRCVASARHVARLTALRGGSVVPAIQSGTYEYNGFVCAFRRKAAAAGFETRPPVLLVHPVGIGLSSWFWDQFLDAWVGSELLVPDLIGCGASEEWQPSKKGLFVPLDWVRGLEALWRAEIQRPMVVLSQGGLAPLAIQLAARQTDTWRGDLAVCGLVLASPPEWQSLSTGSSQEEVMKNYGQLEATLGSPSALGTLAYRALCARPFVQLFSSVFLYGEERDDFQGFVDACCENARPERRWPVIAFNAGMVGQRGLEDELLSLQQPTLVLIGNAKGKPLVDGGRDFEERMRNCKLRGLQGRNVLPWESAPETCDAVRGFVADLPDGTTTTLE